MDLSSAVSAAASTLRRRPADLLPFYLLGTAVPVIARMGLFVALAGTYLHYELTGQLDDARRALTELDLTPPDTQDPEAVQAWVETVAPALEPRVADRGPASDRRHGRDAPLGAPDVRRGLRRTDVGGRRPGPRPPRAHRRNRRRTGTLAHVPRPLRHRGSAVGRSVTARRARDRRRIPRQPLPRGRGRARRRVARRANCPALVVRAVFAFAPAAVVVDETGVVGAVEGAGGFIRSNPVDAPRVRRRRRRRARGDLLGCVRARVSRGAGPSSRSPARSSPLPRSTCSRPSCTATTATRSPPSSRSTPASAISSSEASAAAGGR